MSRDYIRPRLLSAEERQLLRLSIDRAVRERFPYVDDEDEAESAKPRRHRQPHPQRKLIALITTKPVPLSTAAPQVGRRVSEDNPAPGSLAALAIERGRTLVSRGHSAHDGSGAAA